MKNALANARQFSGPGPANATATSISAISTAWFMAKTRAKVSRAADIFCIRSSALRLSRRRASRSTIRRKRCLDSRKAAAKPCASMSCSVPAEQSLPDYLKSGWMENVDPASVEEFTVNGFPAATATAGGDNGRSVCTPCASAATSIVLSSRPKTRTPQVDRAFRESIMTFRRMSSEGKPAVHAAASENRDRRRQTTRSRNSHTAWRRPTTRSNASACSTASGRTTG